MDARRTAIAIDLMLLLLAAAMAWAAARMPSGTVSMPGPGLVPLTLGVLLAVTSLAHLASFLLASAPADVAEEEESKGSRWRIAITLSALLASALLFEPLGYVLTASLFLTVMLWTLSDLGPWRAALAAVSGAWASFILFREVLGVALPQAPFPLPFWG
jgi:putative tricarboxylic transport membrane protein